MRHKWIKMKKTRNIDSDDDIHDDKNSSMDIFSALPVTQYRFYAVE
jgi:hypothetical protein